MPNLIKLQEAINEIKKLVENAIKKDGTTGKNNLIRSQKPIKLLHDVVKSELIKNKVKADLISPKLGESNGELALAGFFKRKNQDVSVTPNSLKKKEEILNFQGILYGQKDEFGLKFTEQTLTINVRSQLSSSAKNFDTLYERTFAEALNLHLRSPKMVLGEFYMISVNEYDSTEANDKKIKYKNLKNVSSHIEKYILSFGAVNGRKSDNADHYKYERVCLLIVDFSQKIPKIYNTDAELKKDNLLPKNTIASIENLSFPNFITDLLKVYSTRFGTGKLS
jgi:hypothetical protein